MDPSIDTLGGALIAVICIWAVWHLATQIRSNVDSGTAMDSTLNEVRKEDNRRLFWLQLSSFVLLIVVSALIGIGAILFALSSLMRAP
jgi:hypothetical protein